MDSFFNGDKRKSSKTPSLLWVEASVDVVIMAFICEKDYA